MASNTTMNHLFAGINADPLRTEPYIPAFFKTNSLFASDVGIDINKDASYYYGAEYRKLCRRRYHSRNSGQPDLEQARIFTVYRPWYKWRACIWKTQTL